jgi:acyl carrier protein
MRTDGFDLHDRQGFLRQTGPREIVEMFSSEISEADDYSLVKLTPGHLELLSRRTEGKRVRGWSRMLVIGGEALSGESLEYWQEQAPETRLINEYGPTETVVGCSIYEVSGGERVPGWVPIGRPIGNVQLYVLDEEGEVVAEGVKGEIVIGGAGVGRGYVGRAAETAERFRPDGYSGRSGARVYHSGDVGRYRADGEIEYVGRRDEQVKVRGYRIELGEIEAVLREHSGIREAVAIVREDAPTDKRLVAFVVAEPEGAVAVEELRQQLKERLPEYMLPASIVPLVALPLTPNGKLDRQALARYEALHPRSEAVWVAPQTKVEQAIAAIWEDVLGLERVGVHDNFFELGGHSLLLIRVHLKLQDEFSNDLTLIELFEYPTIRSLARHFNGKEDQPSFQAVYDRAELRRDRRKARRQHAEDVIETAVDGEMT